MKILLNEKEVIELAYSALDMNCPDPDQVDTIAKKMDMVYNEDLDMYEDVGEIFISALKRNLKDAYHALQDKSLNNSDLRARISDALVVRSTGNCNHSWYSDMTGTVAIRRCRFCKETDSASLEQLWEK